MRNKYFVATFYRSTKWMAIVLVLMTAGLNQATAASITVTAFDTGWWNQIGDSNNSGSSDLTSNTLSGITGINNITGVTREFHNFFAFDLSAVSGLVTGAVLRLGDVHLGRNSTIETYTVFDYTSSITSLVSTTGNVSIFTDLGSGSEYGSVSLFREGFGPFPTDTDEGLVISILLNALAVADINTSLGALFAVGGNNVTASSSEFGDWVKFDPQLFTGTDGQSFIGTFELVLDITPVPLPAALPLFGTGLGILGFLGWRRRRKAAA